MHMLYAFIVIFIVSLLCIAILKHYASKWHLLDVPNLRSMHKKIMPRGAGIAFTIAVMLVSPFYYFDFLLSYLWTIFAIFLIFLVGSYDDIMTTSPKIKFLVIIFSTLLLSNDNIFISSLGTFFSFEITLYWLALPFTIFVVSGFTNALNLIDGIDGLSGSISIVILTSFFYIGYRHEDIFIMIFSSIFIAALFAFLYYNWYPASIFMGDSGSLLLGFIISLLGIKSLAYIPAVSILYLGAIPILDTLIVMIRRKRAGRSFFAADSCHMHHLLKEVLHDNTPRTVYLLVSWQIVYALFGLQLNKEADQGIFLVIFMVNIFVLYKLFEKMIEKQKRKC